MAKSKTSKSLKRGTVFPKKRDSFLLKKESDLVYLFAASPWKPLTESGLREDYGTKSKSYISLFLDKYVREGILKTEQTGSLTTYHLDLSSAKARTCAGAVLEFAGWSRSPRKEMEKIIEKNPYASHITLITGSYAKGTQTEKSDIDVVIIIEDQCDPRRVKANLNLHCELSIPYIHLYVFRNSEFISMLKDREANYGKEIVKNCLILTQGQTYLKLIDEAMKNGFDYKHLDQ